jgi:hypothetical protein
VPSLLFPTGGAMQKPRLRYTYRSLLDIFLVFNHNWLEIDNIYRTDLNQFLLKVQYSWRR